MKISEVKIYVAQKFLDLQYCDKFMSNMYCMQHCGQCLNIIIINCGFTFLLQRSENILLFMAGILHVINGLPL